MAAPIAIGNQATEDKSLAKLVWDLKAPAKVTIYPLPPTPGCSTTMPLSFVHELYTLVIRGKAMPLSTFVQDGITFKIEVQQPGQSAFQSAYTFNKTTNILHRPQATQQELAIKVSAKVGQILQNADEEGCAGQGSP